MNPIQTLKKLKEINLQYYAAAHMARQNGKFIAYVNAFTPVELIYAMDMIPIYPENHAVVIAARHMSAETARAAEGMGYSMDLCSYAALRPGVYQDQAQPDLGTSQARSAAHLQQSVRHADQMVGGAQQVVRRAHGAH